MSAVGVNEMGSKPVSNRPRLALFVVGIVGVAFSLFGLWYHSSYLAADYSRRQNPPYFFQAWHAMAAVDIAFLVGALVLGIGLIRGLASWVPFFVALQVLIVLKGFVIGWLWLNPQLGPSIAAATGISGGTVLFEMTLYSVWGSVIAIWAARRLRQDGQHEVEQPGRSFTE